jgi:hypothetical protein
LNSPQDRLAIGVTEPLTTDEDWVAMAPGQLQVFVDGVTTACSGFCDGRPDAPQFAPPVAQCLSACAASKACKNMEATSNPV